MNISSIIAVLASMMMVNVSALAQPAYSPDVAEFKGGDSYAFPANSAFDLSGGGTIEFWVGTDWTGDPGYDPVVLSNTGAQGSSYLIAINGERTALVINSADRIEAVPFDFRNDKLHHVAIVNSGADTFVMIDGVILASLALAFEDKPSAGLWIGSANGKDAPFVGAIAQLRLWSIALDPLTIISYLQSDIDGEGAPHPDIEFLAAESDFHSGALLVDAELTTEDSVNAEVVTADLDQFPNP